VLSENRRVLGLMPHPERAVEAELGGADGRAILGGILHATLAA
jgi:phosphoribosylformylglycinamidine synthase